MPALPPRDREGRTPALEPGRRIAYVSLPAVRHRRRSLLLAAVFVLVHVLAPGLHAVQLRIEHQRGKVARICCFAGTGLGVADRGTPAAIDRQGRRLLHCAVGQLLLTQRDFLPPSEVASLRWCATVAAIETPPRRHESDRRPERLPARAPPR